MSLKEDNREAIEEKILEAKKETNGTMQGWHVDVEIDENGKVWTGDLFSVGSQSMSSWKGETFIVCNSKSWNAEGSLNVEQEMKYNDNQKYLTEYQKQKEEGEINESAYDFMSENYPEILEQWEDENEEAEEDWIMSEFDPSEILDQAIEDERAYRQYEEN